MKTLPSEKKLVVSSKTEKLRLVREFVEDGARSVGFDEDTVAKISLAVDEACTNIIKHSYKFDPNQRIEITLVARDRQLEIVISDHGVPFDPESVKLPQMPEYLHEYRRGGLGMYLMKSLMDKVEYRANPGKYNEVRLTKYLGST